MDIFEYLKDMGITVQNTKVLYHLERLSNSEVKIESLQKARQRSNSQKTKNILDITCAIWKRYIKSKQQ